MITKPAREIVKKLTDFNSWNIGKHKEDLINLYDYATFIATPDLIFSVAELFCPKLIKHDGCTFFDYDFEVETYNQWKDKGLSSTEIERVMNHQHMFRVLQGTEEIDLKTMKACAETITSFWSTIFKDQKLVGEVIDGDSYELSITLYTIK